jgi:Icc-related predicted phosphoesterase
MSNIESIFNDPEKAMAIIFHMTNSHEIAAQTITDLHKSIIKATDTVNQTHKFLDKLVWMEIPQNMLANIEMARDARESFANLLSNLEAERVDYDNYMMEIYSLTLELCTIGQQVSAVIGNTDEFQIDHLIPNRESFFKEVYDLFTELSFQSKDEVQEYANL